MKNKNIFTRDISNAVLVIIGTVIVLMYALTIYKMKLDLSMMSNWVHGNLDGIILIGAGFVSFFIVGYSYKGYCDFNEIIALKNKLSTTNRELQKARKT